MRVIKFRAFINGVMISSYDLSFEFFDTLSYQLAGCENLMQFTGIKDRDGTEIFESDILKYDEVKGGLSNSSFVVKWSEKDLCFYGNGFPQDWTVYCTVIGNIHENPNLLDDVI